MTTSKRSSANASESEAKRARLAMDEYEVVLGDEIYVNVDQLFHYAELKDFFAKRYKRSAKSFIAEEDLHVVFVSKKSVENGELRVKTSYAPKSDVRLAKKDERVERLIVIAKENSYPLAPPVIADKDLTFFVDKAGASYQVEMRGERTMNGIYFKAKDVGVVFESRRLPEIIQRGDSTYRESIDFVWFALLKSKPTGSGIKQRADSDPSDQGHLQKSDTSLQEHHSVQRASTKEIFLTFSGLMHALHNTRSPVAEEFRGWVYKQVFTLAYGTVEQKKEMLSTLCKIDKTFLQAFMKLVPNDLACIYLVDTTIRDGDAKVYKFGRSGKIKDRFYDHHFTFGAGTLLDTVIFVPADTLSEAETILRKSIIDETHFRYDKTAELVTLNNADRKAVRTVMQTIADKYNGSMTIQASKHAEEIKDLKHVHKTQVDDLKHVHKVQTNDLKYTYELRVKDLECVVAVFEKQMETVTERMRVEELRLENAQLKAAAEINTKNNQIEALQRTTDAQNERIRELEELNRRLSKRFPEAE
ncbi:hypothetical protein FI667_g16798, partial [Globisporangium splendens]